MKNNLYFNFHRLLGDNKVNRSGSLNALVTVKMANLPSRNAAEGYKESSQSVQKVEGEIFIQADVIPQAGDAILDLGCGTGELSAYLAELVGPEGKVVGVDPDKERILLAQQSHGEIKNLSLVEGSEIFTKLRKTQIRVISANCLFLFYDDRIWNKSVWYLIICIFRYKRGHLEIYFRLTVNYSTCLPSNRVYEP